MKLQLTLTKREIDALKTVANRASVEADAMISDDDKSQMKIGYEMEHGVGVIYDIIKLAGGKE